MYLSSISSRIIFHETCNWELKKVYGCCDGLLRDLSWSDDGKYLLQVNTKGLVEILSASDQEVKSLQHIPVKETWSASFHRDGHRNIAIGTKGNVVIWDTKLKTIIKTFPTMSHQSNVNHISYNSRNTSLAASVQNGDTIIYGLVSNIPVLTVKLACSKSISAMKFHHDSRSLLGLATYEGHVVLRDITTNRDKAFFENVHASPVSDFAYSPINKDVLLSSGYDQIMHVYDIRLQNVVSTIRTTYTLTSLAINLENYVALGTKDGVTLIYDLRNYTKPFKELVAHEEEIVKVAFQPARKKQSLEVGLREDTNYYTSPIKLPSPIKSRSSDLFFIADASPSNSCEVPVQTGDNKADSFLVMMGLDKSVNDIDNDDFKSFDLGKKIDKSDIKHKKLDKEKNISKASTPLNSKAGESFDFSPTVDLNGVTDDHVSNTNISTKLSNVNNPVASVNNVNNKETEDLKEYIKLAIMDVSDDNRNYFLRIMMMLTKQKLFLEKQLSTLSEEFQKLHHSHNDLIETNRRLAIEIDKIKSKQNIL